MTNNNTPVSSDELDSMFDVTPASTKDKLELALANSREKGLVMECEVLGDELMHTSPRKAWGAIKRPFTKG